jgi:hypothetical protein
MRPGFPAYWTLDVWDRQHNVIAQVFSEVV